MTELATTTAPATFSLVPTSFDDAVKISKTLAASQLVPKDYQGKAENCFVAIAWGQELGLAPLQALQNIAVINGRPAIWGDAALAIVMAHPEFEDIEEKVDGEGDKMIATCTIKRRNRSPVVRTFSAADAKKAGLWEKQGPWTQYRSRMMQLRARGFGLRDAFPDALKGFKTVEEVQDYDEKDITPPSRPSVVMPTATAATKAEAEQAEIVDTTTGEITQPEAEPQAQSVEGEATVSEGQLRLIRAKLKSANIDEAVLCEAMGDLPSVAAIPAARCNHVFEWIKKYQA